MTTDFIKEFEIFKDYVLENNPNADIDLIKKAFFLES